MLAEIERINFAGFAVKVGHQVLGSMASWSLLYFVHVIPLRAKRISRHQIFAAAIGVVAALYTNGSSRCSKGFPKRPQFPETLILQIPSSRRPVSDRAAKPKRPFVPHCFVRHFRRC